jgi:hypothetical protein
MLESQTPVVTASVRAEAMNSMYECRDNLHKYCAARECNLQRAWLVATNLTPQPQHPVLLACMVPPRACMGACPINKGTADCSKASAHTWS